MEVSGLFWVVTIVMAVVAFGFIALPLVKNNRKTALIVLAIVLPLSAAGLYLQLGSPGADQTNHVPMRSQAPASDSGSSAGDTKIASVASMLEGLVARLRENPEDSGSWLLLARSYKHLNRIDDAIDAYAHAAALGEVDADLAALGNAGTEVETSGVQIYGNVSLSPDAVDIVQATDTVFIFAKAINGPPAPIAVLRRAVSDLPIDFLLNDSHSMVAGMNLSNFDEVVVIARITRDGDATVALRGLEAKSEPVVLAENRHLNLTIQ